jgi:ABC-type nitrate/sulfonate/bicarbonate transport system ATPase subunit
MSAVPSSIKVALESVSFHYRQVGSNSALGISILKDFDLVCEPSQITAILGPSGCGKSTILDIIAGLRNPVKGRVRITNADNQVKPRLGFIFQRENCLPWLRIEQNLIFGLDSAPSGMEDIVCRLGLTDLLKAYPHELSGGQQQRVAIARILVRKPNLVLCDEPWSSLDIAMRRTVQDEVRSLVKEVGATCVLVTHEPSEALRVADRVVVLAENPVRISRDLTVSQSQRTNPLELEHFIADYLSAIGGSGSASGLTPINEFGPCGDS